MRFFSDDTKEWIIEASLTQTKAGWSHKRPPDVEVRRHPVLDQLETWFHMQTSEGTTLCRFAIDDMPTLLAEWTNFIERIETHKDLIVIKDFYNWLLGDKMASSQAFQDRAGRVMPPVIYFKHSFSKNFSVGVGRFEWRLSLAGFKIWLDQVTELHRPYIQSSPQ